MTLFLQIAAVALGLAALVWSADRFVDGASATARLLGVPQLLVGMVVVGFGTSAPELTVSAFAAADGSPALALGNAFGSNVCNIALILGVCAALRPIPVHRPALVREIPIVLAATGLAGWMLWDDALGRGESLILLAAFVAFLTLSSVMGLRERRAEADGAEEPARPSLRPAAAALWLVVGLAGLVASSKALVWGASGIARAIGASDLLIGLTIVAIGTSLPELASSVAATVRGEDDLAVGNIIGSNLFNTLAVVGLAGTISPMKNVPDAVRCRDLPVTAAFTLALLLLAACSRTGRQRSIPRLGGALLLAGFVVYTVFLLAEETGAA